MRDPMDLLEASLLGETDWIGIEDLCRLCDLSLEMVTELVDLGVVSPRGYSPEDWQLPVASLPRLRTAGRLIHDLGLNVSGAALAVELLDVQRKLERRVRQLERLLHEAG